MKYRLKVDTPLGTYYSKVTEEDVNHEVQDLLNLIKQNLEYLNFSDEDGNEVIIKKETLNNSVLTLETIR